MIGNDVWIGRNALILSGCKIGSGAVIGAMSVVAQDVEPYSVVVGNPGKHSRFRFRQEIIDDLLSISWWDWPMEMIKEAMPLLLSDNIDAFIKKYKK